VVSFSLALLWTELVQQNKNKILWKQKAKMPAFLLVYDGIGIMVSKFEQAKL